jgi:MFS transporter, DHA3 family, macrolide efflux protein
MYLRQLLSIRGFRDLWLGQAISQLGDSIYYVAFMFMAQNVTGSFAMVGYVGAMEMLPYLLFGPYAGVLADRVDRRKVMLWSDFLSGASLAIFCGVVLLSEGKPPVWSLLVIPFALSSVRCIFMPAKSASIPNLVPVELLNRANALSMGTFNFVSLMGLAFAATVIAKLYSVSPQWFFAILLALNALSFWGSAVFIYRLPALLPDREHQEVKHPFEDFKAGLRFIRSRHDLKMYILLLAVFRMGVAPFFVVYVAANKMWFGGRPESLMWLEMAFFAGMMVGSGFAGKLKIRRPTMAFSVELALIGVLIGGMAIPNLWVFLTLNFVCGLVVAAGDVPMITYLQASVPDGYRGRMNAVRDMVSSAVMPIGMVLAGVMLRQFGLVLSFVAMAGVMVAAGLAGFLDRRYRGVRMPEAVFSRIEPAGETVAA